MERRTLLAGIAGSIAAAALPRIASAQARKGYDFIQVDVFSRNKLEGNPLPVFINAAGLTDVQMQNIARELNHSETTFILPATGKGDARVRIFGTNNELPFAGHPTLGTAFVMSQTRSGRTSLVLEENVGPIPVTLEKRADGTFIEMTQNEPVFGAKADPQMIADTVGINADEIDDRYAPQMVSTGTNFLIVPLKSVATLAKLKVGFSVPPDQRKTFGTGAYYVVTGEPQVESRMIGASNEDPATGSAVGCATAFLVQNGIRKPDERVAILQGRFVNRPSTLYVRAGMANGKATNVRVGGYVVEVARGTFTV